MGRIRERMNTGMNKSCLWGWTRGGGLFKKFRCCLAMALTCILIATTAVVGVPVKSAAVSEKFFLQWECYTINELSTDNGKDNGRLCVSVYDEAANAPNYKLNLPGMYVKTNENTGVKTYHYMWGVKADVFSGKTFTAIRMEICDGYNIANNALENIVVGDIVGSAEREHDVVITPIRETGGNINVIALRAFQGMQLAGDFLIDADIHAIGQGAFKDVKAGGTFQIKNTVTDIVATNAFDGMEAGKFVFQSGVKELRDQAFHNSPLEEFIFSDDIEKIGNDAFLECDRLKRIVLPNNATIAADQVGETAFPNQEGLTIEIPETLRDISVYHVENLDKVNFHVMGNPAKQTVQSQIDFLKDNGLSYTLEYQEQEPNVSPKPTENPGTSSAPNASAEPTEKPGNSSVPGASAEPTEKPGNSSVPGASAKPTEKPGNSSVPGASPKPTGEPGAGGVPGGTPAPGKKISNAPRKGQVCTVKKLRYKVTGSSTVSFVGAKSRSIKKIAIPGTVTICKKLFRVKNVAAKSCRGYKKLQSVSVGYGVQKIGREAFADCPNLKKITLGESVLTIGAKAFARDRKLSLIKFKGKRVKSIGKRALYKVPKSVRIVVPRKKKAHYQALIRKSNKK